MHHPSAQTSVPKWTVALRTILVALPLIFLLGMVVVLSYRNESALLRDSLVADEQSSLRLRAETLRAHVRDVQRDVRFLATGPALEALVRDEARDLRYVERIFCALMDAKPYDQVRLLDVQGNEVVRVNSVKGRPLVVPSDQLQNKAGRYYFKGAMALEKERIYLSPLDLNVEHGEVEVPYKPVLRFATPLFSPQGQRRGVLVINALMGDVLDQITRHGGIVGSQTMIVDSLGYWLRSPYPDDQWGFQILSRATRTFQSAHPDAWRSIERSPEVVVDTDLGLYLSLDVRLDAPPPDRMNHWGMVQGRRLDANDYFLRLISFIPNEVLDARLSALRDASLAMFGGGSLFAVVLALLLARAMGRARELGRRLQDVLNAASEVSVISTDTGGIITVFNTGAEKMLGYTAEELVGKQTSAVFHKAEEIQARGEELSRQLGRAVEGFEVFVALPREQGSEQRQWTYVHKNGQEVQVDLVVTAIRDEAGEVDGYLGVAVDVTERRAAERAMIRSEERLKLFVKHTPAAVAMFDTQMRYVMVSRRWLEDYSLGDTDVMGRSHYEIFPEIPQRWKDIHARCLRGETMRTDEDVFPRADGSTDYIRWEIVPWREGDGTVGGIVMFTEVVTEKKLAERAVRESEARLNAILESAADGIVTMDEKSIIRAVNLAAARIFGFEPEEMLGRNVNIIQPDPVHSEHDEYVARYLATGEARIIGRSGREVVGRRKDGSTVPLELAVSEVHLDEGRLFTGILRDITERKEAEGIILNVNRQLQDKQARIDRDLRAAAAIQESLLPSAAPLAGPLEIDWVFRPSQQIGGDIFNLFTLDEHHVAAYILDVSGHGVSSALVTVSASQALSSDELLTRLDWMGNRVIRDPGHVMDSLNREFPMERFDMFFTMCYMVLDVRDGSLKYSNAGHPPPLVLRADGLVEPLTEGGLLIGLGDMAGPYPTGEARLECGDAVFFYTDGLTEYVNPANEQYDQHRLEAVLSGMAGEHVDAILEAVMADVTGFAKGLEPDDDISMVCVRYMRNQDQGGDDDN